MCILYNTIGIISPIITHSMNLEQRLSRRSFFKNLVKTTAAATALVAAPALAQSPANPEASFFSYLPNVRTPETPTTPDVQFNQELADEFARNYLVKLGAELPQNGFVFELDESTERLGERKNDIIKATLKTFELFGLARERIIAYHPEFADLGFSFPRKIKKISMEVRDDFDVAAFVTRNYNEDGSYEANIVLKPDASLSTTAHEATHAIIDPSFISELTGYEHLRTIIDESIAIAGANATLIKCKEGDTATQFDVPFEEEYRQYELQRNEWNIPIPSGQDKVKAIKYSRYFDNSSQYGSWFAKLLKYSLASRWAFNSTYDLIDISEKSKHIGTNILVFLEQLKNAHVPFHPDLGNEFWESFMADKGEHFDTDDELVDGESFMIAVANSGRIGESHQYPDGTIMQGPIIHTMGAFYENNTIYPVPWIADDNDLKSIFIQTPDNPLVRAVQESRGFRDEYFISELDRIREEPFYSYQLQDPAAINGRNESAAFRASLQYRPPETVYGLRYTNREFNVPLKRNIPFNPPNGLVSMAGISQEDVQDIIALTNTSTVSVENFDEVVEYDVDSFGNKTQRDYSNGVYIAPVKY